MRILDQIVKTIRSAAVYNPDVQEAPACILWPDHDRQWLAAMPQLQAAMPELFVLGAYDPAMRSGPGIWLRGVLAGVLPAGAAPPGNDHFHPPIFYLPGYSRQDLRDVNSSPAALKPIVELQFRGVIWSQINARDWSILAFLKSAQGGLGLDVAGDAATRSAMQAALTYLLEEEVTTLHGKHLDADYFNGLLTADPVRDLLLWIDQDDAFRQSRSPEEWHAFVAITKSQRGFDPETNSVLDGATLLAADKGAWQPVWQRFCEAPQRYTAIPERMRRCTMPATNLFASAATHAGWPQWNDGQEQALRADLLALATLPPHTARQRIAELETQHGPRRALVWATLGEAPLAQALKPLAALATATALSLAAGAVADLVDGYQRSGWRADAALLDALSAVKQADDVAAVTAAVRVLYLPWAEESARYLQEILDSKPYPGGSVQSAQPPARQPGVCYLFVDGLRFDLAQRLADRLTAGGCTVTSQPRWSALPSVTATAKPAVSPVANQIAGQEVNVDFEPAIAATAQSLKDGYSLHKLLEGAGWQVLKGGALGDPHGSAWCEAGEIDLEGHNRGWKLAYHVDALLDEVAERVHQLQIAGWPTIHVVTDHGWLLLPNGLPKVDLLSVLTDNKWGRCAAIKAGAYTPARLFPWFWNPTQHFALADGISCYRAGMEYAHGGLSLQECLTLQLTVTAANSANSGVKRSAKITEIGWKGLRCTVTVEGDAAGLVADLRTQPGNPASTIASSAREFGEKGATSVVVEDADLTGSAAIVLVLGPGGEILAQQPTIVGGQP